MDLVSPCFRSKKLMMLGSTDYLLYNYSSNDTTVIEAKYFFKIIHKFLIKMKKIKECLKKAAKWYVMNCVFEKGNAYQIY